MDAIHEVAPSVIFFLEVCTAKSEDHSRGLGIVNICCLLVEQGTTQGGLGANWGDGFCCDEVCIRRLGISDPNSLFRALLSRSYKDQVSFPDARVCVLEQAGSS